MSLLVTLDSNNIHGVSYPLLRQQLLDAGAKIPYPFLDPYTRARMERDELWYQLRRR
jgi:hypothetical protein